MVLNFSTEAQAHSAYQDCICEVESVLIVNSNIFSDPLLTCFLKHYNLDRNQNDISFEQDVRSDVECQRECQMVKNCKAFVYRSHDMTCYLKSGKFAEATRTANSEFISGPKYCSKFYL